MHRRNIALGFVGLMSFALAGCGSDSDSSDDIGQAGDKAKAARVVEVRQLDALRFEPATIGVKGGETVTFRVTNTGKLIHEFFLGDKKAHDARDKEMKGMGAEPMKMADVANSLNIEPGATEELTWTFPEKGTVEFACHEPGHHADGMKGTIKVG